MTPWRVRTLLVAWSLVPGISLAQVPAPAATTPPPSPTVPSTAVPPTTGGLPGEDATSSSGEDSPAGAVPEVDDPLLVPPEAPPNVLSSWRDALRMVRSRSTSLAVAEARVASASADARAALAGGYPTLMATGGLRRHLLFGTGTNITAEGPQINVRVPDPAAIWSAGLSFRQPLLAPRTWHDAETAKMSVSAFERRVEDTERLVLAQVADTIVAVVTAERLAEVSRVSLRSSLSTLQLTRRRARLGAGNVVDVLRAEQEVSLNRAQVVNATEAVRRSREALGMALGYPEAFGVNQDIKLDDLARDAQQVCSPISNLDQRADIQAAKVDVEVAKRRAKASDWLLSPTVDLTSDLTYSTSPATANGRPAQWIIGALLTVPLYDGGIRVAERGAGAAQVELSRQLLEQAQRQATLEVKQSLRAVQVAEQNLEVSVKSRDLSRETSRLSRLSFVNGRSTSFELVDSERRHQEAELDLAVKEFDVIRARIVALLARANCDV